jgi:hypothetical protein
MHRAIKRWTVGVALSVASAGPLPADSELPSYKDPNAPVEARLEDLLQRMSLEEKVAQMLCILGCEDRGVRCPARVGPREDGAEISVLHIGG